MGAEDIEDNIVPAITNRVVENQPEIGSTLVNSDGEMINTHLNLGDHAYNKDFVSEHRKELLDILSDN